ncbi:oligosaccharide flippase family protein [Vibrio salinus]|uniref:oligosaccharide flippase family protein n=1 Tax=Vibrio salinus TaxID=2899784 RepID=UPI001E555816|nr:oligosaccharide flippase family protein [Vibrio salinus]MCE0493272.1 oligosaccharide flippase family protein [Vibrio salinus]
MSSKTNKILKASFVLLVMSWCARVFSVLTMIVLARNLNEHDFGIVSGCYVVQSFFNAMVNTGGGSYLLRKKIITDSDINAAWTINLFSKLFMGIAVFVLSDYAAIFLKIPELSIVLKVMSLSAIFQGFYNMAINIQIKELNYSKVSLLTVGCQLVSSSTSMTIAILYHSYWAVIIAEVLYYFLRSLGSHIIVQHKVKLVKKNVFTQWQFSKWIMLKGIVSYIKVSCDKILISRNYNIEQLGLYNFSMESASSASNLIINPIKEVLYPGLSEYSGNKSVFVDKINKSLLVLGCIYMPMVFGGVFLSDVLVPTIFGYKWTHAIPLFNLFLPMTFAGVLVSVLTNIFTLTGKVKRQFIYESITSIIFLSVMYISIQFNDLYYFSILRMIMPYVMLLLIILTLRSIIPISFYRICFLLFPIIFSSCIMIIFLKLFYFLNGYLNNVLFLIFEISLGAISYFLLILVTSYFIKPKVYEYDFLYKTFLLPIVIKIKSIV